MTVAGCAAAVAVIAWFSPVGDNGFVPRVLVVAAAAVACVGAVLLRQWDLAAGRMVAELEAARIRDEWHTEERVAELESDVEESREIRRRQEGELRAQRAELTRLRGEHAELLRRYATAESERARALEGSRRSALEIAPRPALGPAPVRVGPEAYRKAAEALRELSRNAARQQVLRTVEAARRREAAMTENDEAPGRHIERPEGADGHRAALPVREHRLVPAVAAAVLPYAQPRPSAGRKKGGFDFFGVTKSAAAQDLADVVGEEAYETARREQVDAEPEIIDLTAHDETEQLDLRVLRARS